MLKIKQFAFNPFGVNTFIVYDTDNHDALVVDPGMISDRERKFFDDFITAQQLKIRQIVNTHLHLDHCFGDNYVRNKYSVKVAANVLDASMGQNLARQAAEFGMILDCEDSVSIDETLSEGDNITVGNYKFEILHVPGHSPGSIILYCAEGAVVFVGDVLFKGSVGRSDLEGGNQHLLIDGIKTKLMTLPDKTMILPGHGPATTIGTEKKTNSFIR